jgi:hypothetical protein
MDKQSVCKQNYENVILDKGFYALMLKRKGLWGEKVKEPLL